MVDSSACPKKTRGQRIGLILGPSLCLVVLLLDLEPGKPAVTRMAAVTLLMAIYWISEAIPLAATSLLPLVLYPLLGIAKGKTVAPVYMNSVIFLFLGGFIIALAMERWKLHKRIALWIIRVIGCGSSHIILGFMIASAFLSMWISNTATAIMMVPIALAIVINLEEQSGREQTHAFSAAVMLGIAYACSVGGIATLVGTPPNLSFARIFELTFPAAPAITFGQWLTMGLPLTVIMVAVTWVLLTRVFFPQVGKLAVDAAVINREYDALEKTFEQKVVLVVFTCTALLWVFRRPLAIGSLHIPGWSQLLPFPDLIDDGTVAIFMALILFFVPTRQPDAPSATIVDTKVFAQLPWHIVLLFGGGFAMATGFKTSGLSKWIGAKLSGLTGVAPLTIIVVVCSAITSLTELTSNTATTEMILPVLAAAARATKLNPLMLMIPATISASNAFMMPVATPPNAIIFGSGRVRIAEMARVGVFLNLAAIVVLTAVFYLIGLSVFSIDPTVFPAWASEP